MYEKTIAVDFRIYEINLEATFKTVYDLLDENSKINYNRIVYQNGLATNQEIAGRPHSKYRRNPIDGYIVSSQYELEVTCDANLAVETYDAGVEYTVPVWHWPIKTYVRTANVQGADTAIVRIFFS